jgi:hypothetical protein
MRYLRYLNILLVVLIAVWLVFLLMENHDGLAQTVTFTLSLLPTLPSTLVTMPLWVALVLTFTLAFIFAIILEIITWYESDRIIRLQRIQIRKLQEALAKHGASCPSSASDQP